MAEDAGPARATAGRLRVSLRGPTVTTTITNMLILGGNALAGIVSARELGPTGRGQLAIVMLWSGLINVAGIVGLPSACSYYVAQWQDRRASLARLFRRTAVRQAVVMTALSAAILWWLHFHLALPPLLVFEYSTCAAGTALVLYGACYAQGLQDFGWFNTIRLIPGAGPAALMLAGAAAVHLTPAEVGAAYLVPVWCSALPAYFLLRRQGQRSTLRRLSARDRRSIRFYGLRSLASFSGLAMNRSADQVLLGLLVPVASLGLYSVASAASSPLPSLVASLGMVGLPTVSALTGMAKASATWRTLARAACLLAVVSPAVALLLPRLIPLLYGPRYAAAVMPAELLLLGSVFAALCTVADDLLRAHGCPGFVSLTQGAGGVVTLIGTLALARVSLDAVALTSSAGFAVAFVLAVVRLWMLSRRVRAQDLSGRAWSDSEVMAGHRSSASPRPQPGGT